MKQQSPTAFINNNSFTPSNTPTNKARSSKSKTKGKCYVIPAKAGI